MNSNNTTDGTQSFEAWYESMSIPRTNGAPDPKYVSDRCICGRGKYYHPWRFCDDYKPENFK